MQYNPAGTEETKDSAPKYFTENVYREMVKSMNEFSKDAAPGGEGVNVASREQPDVRVKQEPFLAPEPKPGYQYTPMYYVNQPSGAVAPGNPAGQIPEYPAGVAQKPGLVPENYEGLVAENAVLAPKEEYPKALVKQYEPGIPMESDLAMELRRNKSPETSPNLLPASKETYKVKAEIGAAAAPEVSQPELGVHENEKFSAGQAGPTAFQGKQYEYARANYGQCRAENLVPGQGYYYGIPYKQPVVQKKQNVEDGVNYIIYKPKKEVCYFNNIRPIYDENTKSYYPNYQVVDDNNPNLKHRPHMIPNELINSRDISPLFKYTAEGQPFSVQIPYENMDSYFKSTSIKQELEEPQEIEGQGQLLMAGENHSVKLPERRRGSRAATAGRPKLNRNHYSCANCNAKTTPQWRYVKGIAVCNACYMRIRKDKVYPSQNRDKAKKVVK